MAIRYKYMKDSVDPDQNSTSMIIMIDDNGTNWGVPNDIRNRDWQDYQTWLSQGNTPEDAS
jgi:hypothetical protein